MMRQRSISPAGAGVDLRAPQLGGVPALLRAGRWNLCPMACASIPSRQDRSRQQQQDRYRSAIGYFDDYVRHGFPMGRLGTGVADVIVFLASSRAHWSMAPHRGRWVGATTRAARSLTF